MVRKKLLKRRSIKKIITSPLGHDLRDIKGGQFLDDKKIKFIYRKRSRLGKLLKIMKTKDIPIPKGLRVFSIKNHTPRVGKITIMFTKK